MEVKFSKEDHIEMHEYAKQMVESAVRKIVRDELSDIVGKEIIKRYENQNCFRSAIEIGIKKEIENIYSPIQLRSQIKTQIDDIVLDMLSQLTNKNKQG